MRSSVFLICFLLTISITVFGQIQVTVTASPLDDRHTISPYIYGLNDLDFDLAESYRLGGNRLTAYNWETNASNAGDDYYHQSDDYLLYYFDIPEEDYDDPGIIVEHFKTVSNQRDAYCLITLPMAGYVAADMDGMVSESETAPSGRWNEIINLSQEAYGDLPDLTDDAVYSDEFIHSLLTQFGNASEGGVQGYSLDNEPALWYYTHPRIQPSPVTVQDLIDKSIHLGRIVKDMDATAEVFGPALYGFFAYYNLQNAPDWENNYAENYDWFVDAYLDAFASASADDGQRLLDVFDVHWYPEPDGVYEGDTDANSNYNRVQAPRSLWDDTYVEESWIADALGGPIQIIPRLKNSIDTFYPGTKLSITEYDYGAPAHITGGIAQADALGIFGQEDIYLATKWNGATDYIAAAFELYLNYDGEGGKFGDIHFEVLSNDNENNSAYGAIHDGDEDVLHFILLNKNATEEMIVNLELPSSYDDYEIEALYRLDADNPTIENVDSSAYYIDDRTIRLDSYTANHLILERNENLGIGEIVESSGNAVDIYPNPTTQSLNLRHKDKIQSIAIYDVKGGLVMKVEDVDRQMLTLDIQHFAVGTYFIEVTSTHKLKETHQFIKK